MGMKILTEIICSRFREIERQREIYIERDRERERERERERRTRGHVITLAQKQCRLDIRKFSFSPRTVNEWNRLSGDCVGASSVNMFKNKIDIYLRRAGYIQIDMFDSRQAKGLPCPPDIQS